jgi:hypothetical protein
MTRIVVRCLLVLLVNGVFFLNTTGLSHAGTLEVPGKYSTIQAGIDAAVNGDAVLVASGIYTGTGNKNLDFKGKNITVQSVNGPDKTIIDCQNSGRGFLFRRGEGAAARVIGFTIKNGYVDGNSPYGGKGGGIYCGSSSPTILNCIISACKANGFGGGGIALYFSSARIENTIIEYNLTNDTGGGILINGMAGSVGPTVYNSIIRYNKTSGPSSGGGICVIASHSVISYCTISNNDADITYVGVPGQEATNSGGISFRDGSTGILEFSIISHNKAQERGGIGSWNATPTIHNCLIEMNEATVYGGGGIGLYFNSNATIRKSTIRNNLAKEYGGGISIWNETVSSAGPLLEDSIIENNNGGDAGGGLNVFNGAPEISRSIIRNNTSITRAGVALNASNGATSSAFANSLIYGNIASGFGGGVTCLAGGGASISNCTIATNQSGSGNADLYVNSATATVVNSIVWGNGQSSTIDAFITYSDISGGHSGDGNIDTDPQFVSPSDFHLSSTSPCINTGSNSAGLASVDLGGNARVYGAIVDMGAYEFPFVDGVPGTSGQIGAVITQMSITTGNITPILHLLLHKP